MPAKSNESRERAEAKFERLQRIAEEGRIAMAEYKAAAIALRAKTERLRALRLARDEAVDTTTLAFSERAAMSQERTPELARKKSARGAAKRPRAKAKKSNGRKANSPQAA